MRIWPVFSHWAIVNGCSVKLIGNFIQTKTIFKIHFIIKVVDLIGFEPMTNRSARLSYRPKKWLHALNNGGLLLIIKHKIFFTGFLQTLRSESINSK